MRDIDPTKAHIQIIPKGAHHVISTFGTMEQNVLAVIFHSD